MALATVYQKHSSVPTLKVDVYRMTPARCRKVKEGGQRFFGSVKLTTEAPVNGGRNYEPLVVVKFGYMLEPLSIRRYSVAFATSDNPFGAGNQQERSNFHFQS